MTGKLTNTGNIQIINGIIENPESEAILNNGTLTIGENDNEVDITSVAIIGSNIGIEQNGTFNFYDGYIEGKVAINGGHDNTPEDYYVLVDHNNEKDCQKAYLIETSVTAVAKIIENNKEIYYFNLQDAINSAVLNQTEIEIVRDFEAAYVLNVEKNKEAEIDLNGFKVTTGYTITNKGKITIKDSALEKGQLEISVSIENNGELLIQDASIKSTNASNVINNIGNIKLINSTITGLNGYAISNIEQGSLILDDDSYLRANNYALYNNSTTVLELTNGNYSGIYNEGKLKIINGNYTNANNDYVININSGEAIINNINLVSTSQGIKVGKGNLTIEEGKIETKLLAISNEGTLTINDGKIESTEHRGIQNNNTLTINNGEIIAKDLAISSGSGNTTIKGETKIEGERYGVINGNGILTIGEDEGEIKNTPEIKGELYGLYIETNNRNNTNFYDGILKGKTSGYYGAITSIPDATIIKEDKEIIEGEEYQTNYLGILTNFVENGNKQYNNLQTAIEEANSNDTLKLLDNAYLRDIITISSDDTLNLDLNGYNIYTNKGIVNNGNITITTENKAKIYTNYSNNLIINNNELQLINIDLENKKTSDDVLINNSNAILKNVNVDSLNRIYNSRNSTLSLNDCNINTTSTSIYNNGILKINGGTYEGTNYGIYNYSLSTGFEIKNATINAATAVISSGNTLIDSTEINGNIEINGENNELNIGSLSGAINNKGNLTLSDMNITYPVYTSRELQFIDNSGTFISNNSTFKYNKETSNGMTLIGINNTGICTLNNSNFELTDIQNNFGTYYAIKNTGSGILNIDSTNILSSGSSVNYGIYSDTTNNSTTITSGNIAINNAQTTYGIYINNGEVVMGTKENSESTNVSVTEPLISSIGTSLGLGVKKVNGYFKYYDGKIIGSTNAKPDPTTEVEYGYEVVFYNDSETDYEYCILEYMK